MICENCNKEHDGNFGSGRFCSSKCARGYSTKEKREEINQKVSLKLNKKSNYRKISKEEILFAIEKEQSMLAASKYLDVPFSSFKRFALKYNLYKPNQGWAKGKPRLDLKITLENFKKFYLIKNGKCSRIKEKLFEFGIKENKCERCNQHNIWFGKKLELHLHHKNGNKRDNRLGNLEILCPNCHSQTENYGFKNGKNGKNRNYEKGIIDHLEESTSSNLV
jgi:hypothetical protein